MVAAMVFACAAAAADETCASCDKKITLSGEFAHQNAPGAAVPEGAPPGREGAFRESVTGSNFTATISGLPEGKYSVIIGEIEVDRNITASGERVFDITAGDQALARNLDIIAAAGGYGRVCFITNQVEHADDSIRGPLVLTFTAHTGLAKFNSIEIKDSLGSSVYYVTPADLVSVESIGQATVPTVAGPELWKDPGQPRAVRVNDLLSRMSMSEKIRQMGNNTPQIRRLGIPAYNFWSEALHGVARVGVATVFPQAIANGATWDPVKLKQVGHVIGIEARAKFNDMSLRSPNQTRLGLTFWSPNINIYRDPRWGRGQETYGEDTFLTSRMGVAFIEGMQGDDPRYTLAMACAKHYAVHSGPEGLRHMFDAVPPERDFYETYLPHFEAAVREAHVGAVMGAYNAVYGEPACSSDLLLQTLLRKDWGFDGHVVSDCDAIGDIWRNHHTVNSAAAAAARAVIAGCDLCCGQTYNSLSAALVSNLITVKQVDVALGHLLDARFRLGLFDPSNLVPYAQIPLSENDTPAHRQLALDMARESLVLLKNDGLLPLNREKLKRVAVIGANAWDTNMLFGNYNGTPSSALTIYEGIKLLAGTNVEVTYNYGCPLVIRSPARGGRGPGARGFGGRGFSPAPGSTLPAEEAARSALSNASQADVVIYVGGINAQLEGEQGTQAGAADFSQGDRTRIELPQVQQDLIEALYATGKPLIMVNCSGGAMAIPWETEHLPAILQAWYPGEEGGRAVGEVVFGDVSPSGRLPVTFYRSTYDLPDFTNYSMANRTYRYFTGLPLFAFGHGLSYTRFDYSRPSLASKQVNAGDTMKVTFTLTNRGQRDGDEVAQVYFRHINSAVPQPQEALCAFGRVHIPQGKTARVSLDIPVERFRYWDTTKENYTVEAGNYELMIGAASDDIRQRVPFTVVAR